MRAFLMIGFLTVAVPDRPDPTPKEAATRSLHEQIQGDWQVVASTAGGSPNTTIAAGRATFRFDGDKMILRLDPGGPPYNYQFWIESTKSPAFFDFAMGKAGQKNAGIVKIEGDVLTICYLYSNQKGRPTEFVSPAGSSSAVWQMRRIKK